MTGTALITRVRSLIQEYTAKFWEDVNDIIFYLNDCLILISNKIASGSYEGYWTEQTITVADAARYIDLPDGANHGGIPKVNEIGVEAVYWNDNTHPMLKGNFRYFKRSDNTPTQICIRGNQIHFNGIVPVGTVLTVQYWYEPTEITMANQGNAVDIPRAFVLWLVYEATVMCLIKDEADITQIMAMKNQVEQKSLRLLKDRLRTSPSKIPGQYQGGY